MQTVKELPSSIEERKNLALEQSALFPTLLALARWTSGAEPLHIHHPSPPIRAVWLAKAQHDFQSWLEAGGFVQYDQAANEPGPDGHHAESWAS